MFIIMNRFDPVSRIQLEEHNVRDSCLFVLPPKLTDPSHESMHTDGAFPLMVVR